MIPKPQDSSLMLYTVEEVAEILKVNPRTVYRYISHGELESIKLSRRKTRIQHNDLLKFLNRAKGKVA